MSQVAIVRLMLAIRTSSERRVVGALLAMELAGVSLWGVETSYFRLGRAISIMSRPHHWQHSNREIRAGLAAAEEDGLIRVRRPAVRCQPIVIEKGERLIAR